MRDLVPPNARSRDPVTCCPLATPPLLLPYLSPGYVLPLSRTASPHSGHHRALLHVHAFAGSATSPDVDLVAWAAASRAPELEVAWASTLLVEALGVVEAAAGTVVVAAVAARTKSLATMRHVARKNVAAFGCVALLAVRA